MMFKILLLLIASTIPAGLFTLTVAVHNLSEIMADIAASHKKAADSHFTFVELVAMQGAKQ